MAKFTFKNKTTGLLETIQVMGEAELEEARILSIDERTIPVTIPKAAIIREGEDVVYFYPDGSSLRLKRIFTFIAEGKIGQGFLDNLQAATDVESVDVSSDGSDSSEDDGLGNLDDLDSRDTDENDNNSDADPIVTPPLAAVVAVPPTIVPPAAVVQATTIIPELPGVDGDPANPKPRISNDEPFFRPGILDFSDPTTLQISGQIFDNRLNASDPLLVSTPRERYYNDRDDSKFNLPEPLTLVNITADRDGLSTTDLDSTRPSVTVTTPSPDSVSVLEPFGSLVIQGHYGTLEIKRSSGSFVYTLNGGVDPDDSFYIRPEVQLGPNDPPFTPLQLLELKVDQLRSGQFLADFFRYKVQDTSSFADGSLTIRIAGQNDAPTTHTDEGIAVEKASAPTNVVLLPDPLAPVSRPTETFGGSDAHQGTRVTGILGNDTDAEPTLQDRISPNFRYVATVGDFSEFTHDGTTQVERAVYQSSANPNAAQDAAGKWAVSGIFTNLSNGSGGTGFGNLNGAPAVTSLVITGRFGDLKLSASGSWEYTPTSAIIPLGAVDVFRVKLYDLSAYGNQADGVLSGNGSTTTTLGFDTADKPYTFAGDLITISQADVDSAVSGIPKGVVNKAIPNGHDPFNVTDLAFPADPSTGPAVDSHPGQITGTLTINGDFGTLVVNKSDGSYTYTINNNNAAVDALGNNAGNRGTLTEVFRYTMADENPFDTAAQAIKRDSTLTITIQGSNDSPVFTLNAATLSQTTREDTAVVLTTAQLNAVDVDDNAGGLFYTITTAPAHGTIVHNVTGDLAVGARFTQAELADGRISYRPTADYFSGDNTPPLTAVDSVTVNLNDGGEDGSITQTFTVGLTVRPVNDAPTATAPAASRTFTEVVPPNPAAGSLFTAGLFAGSTASTGPANEFAQRITELQFTISNVQSGGQDRVLIDGTDVTLTPGTVVAATTGNAYAVNVGTAGAALTITVSGVLTTGQVAALLDNLSFRNVSEDPSTALRTLTLTRITDNGATPDPGVDFSDLNAATFITVVNVNDAPVFTGGAPVATAGDFTENAVSAGAAAPIDLFTGGTVNLIESVNTVDTVTRLVFEVTGVPSGVPATPAQAGSFEKLVIGGVDVTLVDGTTLPAGGLNASVTTQGTGLRVELTGSISAAAATALIEGMGYRNTSEDPVAGARSVTLVSIRDSGGVVNGGVDESVFNITKNFNVVAVNDRPIASAGTAGVIFSEGDAGTVAVFTAANANPIEQLQTFTQLVFRITGAIDGAAESLTFNGTPLNLAAAPATPIGGGETVTITAGGAGDFTLTVNGDLTIPEANALIEGVRYRNNLANPTDGDRTVSLVSLTDSGPDAPLNTSLPPGPLFSTIVNVNPVNDLPEIGPIVAVAGATFLENAAAGADLFNGAAISTVEAGQTIDAIILTVSGVVDGASERLVVNGTAIPLQSTPPLSPLGLPSSLTASVQLVGTTATVVISGDQTATEASSLINNLTYQHTSNVLLAGFRDVTLVSIRDSGGVLNGGVDLLTVGTLTTVTLTPVNDAPVDSGIVSAAPAAATYVQDSATGADLFNGSNLGTVEPGQSISEIILTVSNVVDGTAERLVINGTDVLLQNGSPTVPGLTANVAVVAGLATLTITGSLSVEAARALLNNLTYLHDSDVLTGTRPVTLVSVRDDGGTANGGDDLLSPGLTTTVTLVNINDAPVTGTPITAANATFTENDAAGADVFNGALLSTVETDQSFSEIILTVTNIADGANERLVLNGVGVPLVTGGSIAVGGPNATVSVAAGIATITVTGSMTPAAADALINGLTYSHTSETIPTGTRAITLVSIRDDGGTTGGGVDLFSPGLISTVTVTALNDAPVLAAGAGAPVFDQSVATAVILAPALTLSDNELGALNGGAGNFTGSRLTVLRTGGADADDVFSFAAIAGVTNTPSSATAGDLLSGGQIFATYALTAGSFGIDFVNNGTIPTQALVESVARSVQYSNAAAGDIGAHSLDFTLTDGNSVALEQGTGVNLAGTTVVNVNVVAPIALDLDGDGIHFAQATDAHALQFDLDGDHIPDSSAWVKSGDGILVHDANRDGLVSDRSEFVFTDTGHGRTDLAALAISFDSNHDSILDAKDTGWADFKVWQDLNGDLHFDTDELSSLSSLGIVSLSLTGHGGPTADGNVLVHQTGSFQMEDGTSGQLADASFAFSRGLPAADEVLHATPEIPLPPAPLPAPAAEAAMIAQAGPTSAAEAPVLPEAPAPVPPPPAHEEVQPHAVA